MEQKSYLFIVYNDQSQPIHCAIHKLSSEDAKDKAQTYMAILKEAYVTDAYILVSDRPLTVHSEPEFGFGPPW